MEFKQLIAKFFNKKTFSALLACFLLFIVYKIQYYFIFFLFYDYPSRTRDSNFSLFNIDLIPGFEPYWGTSIIITSLSNPYVLFYFLVCLMLVIVCRNNFKWEDFGIFNIKFRVTLTLIISILSWTYSFYDYNYFLNSFNLIDRILLIILNISIFFSPLFIFFYLPVFLLIMSQFNYMIGGYDLTDKQLLINLVFIINSWVFISLLTKLTKKYQSFISNYLKNERLLLTSLLIVFGASYYLAFLGKVRIGDILIFDWWLIEDFSIATAKYFDRGWLAFVSTDIKEDVIYVVNFLQKPLLLLAFLTEALAIFLFVKKRITIIIFLLLIILHINILALSGIFFWKWILADLFILVYLISKDKFLEIEWKVAGTVFIVISSLFVNAMYFGWYSIPYQSHYYLSAVDQTDNEFYISGTSMAPYDIFFTFPSWDVLNEPVVAGKPWNQSPNHYSRLLSLNVNELKEFDKRYGEIPYDENKHKVLRDFLKEYFQNYNADKERKNFLGIFTAPKHIYMHHNKNFKYDRRVHKINIYHKRCYYETALVKECKEKKLDTVQIVDSSK